MQCMNAKTKRDEQSKGSKEMFWSKYENSLFTHLHQSSYRQYQTLLRVTHFLHLDVRPLLILCIQGLSFFSAC